MAAARYDWETIRAEYEAGATMGELSKRHGVDKAAISRRAKKEGWLQDVTGSINRLAEAKVNGLVNTVDPQKKAAAMAAAADRKAAVLFQHREAWAGANKQISEARDAGDFDRLKCLKIAAEAMRIVQDGERKAWGIVDTPVEQAQAKDVNVTLDFSGRTREELRELVRAAFGREQH